VDEETGKVSVVRLHAPIYAGRVINRPAAELQNEGSMIMGLGTALFESNEFADGQITNANLSDYNVPAMDDMPDTLSHELVEREGGEVQGLGETALPPVPPAIGNALHSLGIHVTELPISPERVLDAVDVRDGRDETPAITGAHPVSANRHGGAGDGAGERIFAGTPDGSERTQKGSDRDAAGILTEAKRLATSESSKLFFGTLGVGLVPIIVVWLFRRSGGGENK
jgi:hypothetical protein